MLRPLTYKHMRAGNQEEQPTSLLLVLTDLWCSTGGIAVHNQLLCRAARHCANGKGNVQVISLNDSNSFSKQTAKLGVTFKGCEGNSRAFVLAVLKHALLDNPRTVLLAHLNFTPIALLLRCVRPRLHQFIIAYGVEAWVRRSLLDRFVLKRVSKTIAISHITKKRLSKANGIRPGRISVLHCALLPEMIDAARRGPGLTAFADPENVDDVPNKTRMILTVGRLNASEQLKGHDRVIAALPQILERFPNTTYVIVGEGDDRQRLERVASRHEVSGNVVFAGRVSDDEMHRFYSACDIYAMPSIGEGFGFVFIEAMMHKKAVVAGTMDAAGESVVPGKTGLLVDPFDVDAIAGAICDLLSDDNKRQMFGQAGWLSVQERFLPQRYYREFAHIVGGRRSEAADETSS